MKLSIIIPTKDDKRIFETLSKLKNQINNEIEVIVVDDCSDFQYYNSLPKWVNKIRLPINAGSYAARNKGVVQSRGDILAFIDSDCLPTSNWVSEGLASVEPGYMVGGPVDLFPENPDSITGAEALEIATSFPMKEYAKRGYLGAGNLWLTKNDFIRSGWFDGSYYGGGDTEFGKRSNLTIKFNENLRVLHHARNIRSLLPKTRRLVDTNAHMRLLGDSNRRRYPGYPNYQLIKKIILHDKLTTHQKLKAILTAYYRFVYSIYYSRQDKYYSTKKVRWMLPGKTIRWIKETLPEGSRILEFGSGFGSSHLATKYNVTSVEHDSRFINLFANVNYVYAPINNGWYDKGLIENVTLHNQYDLIIIDGPPEKIGRLGILGIKIKAPYIIVDDTQRTQERMIANKLSGEKKIIVDGKRQSTVVFHNWKETGFMTSQPHREVRPEVLKGFEW